MADHRAASVNCENSQPYLGTVAGSYSKNAGPNFGTPDEEHRDIKTSTPFLPRPATLGKSPGLVLSILTSSSVQLVTTRRANSEFLTAEYHRLRFGGSAGNPAGRPISKLAADYHRPHVKDHESRGDGQFSNPHDPESIRRDVTWLFLLLRRVIFQEFSNGFGDVFLLLFCLRLGIDGLGGRSSPD